MLKKLKLKFVVVTMGILLIMLSILFGLIYHFTKSDMESGRNAAIGRLEHVNSIRELPRDVELPYFIVFTNDRGEYLAAGYTDYDLNDTAFLEEIVFRANKGKTDEGILEDHDLLYCLRQNAGGTNYIFLDISSQSATLQNLIQNCVIIGVIGIVAFLVLSVLLARWMVQPVEKTFAQADHDGLVAHQRLVVAFAVAHRFLLGAAAR